MKKIRIYILDDDRFYGALIRRALQREDLEVTYFQCEHECLKALSNAPDILILDHRLEETTGLQILEAIQERLEHPPVVIYLSAQEHVHVALKALHMGAANYLEKSEVTLDLLQDEIDRIARDTRNFLQPLDRRKYQQNNWGGNRA